MDYLAGLYVNGELKPVDPARLKWITGRNPPHLGWWNATTNLYVKVSNYWRWWDGKQWFQGATPNCKHDRLPTHTHHPERWPVKWNESYPLNARVPRVDPTKAP